MKPLKINKKLICVVLVAGGAVTTTTMAGGHTKMTVSVESMDVDDAASSGNSLGIIIVLWDIFLFSQLSFLNTLLCYGLFRELSL